MTAHFSYIENLTCFLSDQTGSVLSVWKGKMAAKEQRALFGRYIGKGLIVVNGDDETICNQVKVCFGQDYDNRNITRWADL